MKANLANCPDSKWKKNAFNELSEMLEELRKRKNYFHEMYDDREDFKMNYIETNGMLRMVSEFLGLYSRGEHGARSICPPNEQSRYDDDSG